MCVEPVALGASPFLPAWAVLPVAGLVMLFVAGHVLAINDARAEVPTRRRRIRTANGVILMWVCALVAYGTSILDPSDARRFVLTWSAVTALVGVAVLLALFDALNTIRMHARARKEIRRELRESIEHLLGESQHQGTLRLAGHDGSDEYDERG